MKWFVLSYVVILTILYILFSIFKKRKNALIEKGIFLSIWFCNVLFFGGLALCLYHIREEQYFLRKEHENIVLTHEYVNDLFSSVSDEVLVELQEDVRLLEEESFNLEVKRNTLSSEIKELQYRYVFLSTPINEAVNFSDITEYMISDFPTYDQRKYYPNGCESVSLYLLLKYHGVSVTPEAIIANLKMGDTPHMEGNVKYGGDPEIEFVGNPKDTSGYGVFENPILDVANQFKSGIKKITGTPLSDVLELVKEGHPVQVWASSYQRTPTKCNTWIHKESGKTITWYCNFHSLVLIGASKNKVIVSDPLTGTIVKYDRNRFEAAYNFYGRRAIYYE